MLLTLFLWSTPDSEHIASTINSFQHNIIYQTKNYIEQVNQQQISLVNDGAALVEVESLYRDIHTLYFQIFSPTDCMCSLFIVQIPF